MKTLTLLVAAGLAAAAFAAQASPDAASRGPHAGMDRLRQADTNGDGMINRDEAKALPMIARHFDEIDANQDNQITVDELRAFHEAMRAQHFKKLDTDGDGRISRGEAEAAAPRLAAHFDQLDANKDGFLTPEELPAAGHRHHGPRGQ